MNPLNIVIRPAEPVDAERIHDLHTASVRGLCSGHYSAEVIDGWLMGRSPSGYLGAIQRGVLFVAQRDERVLGFGHFGTGKVVAIFVDPTAARCGVGRMLLNHAMTEARKGWSGPIRLEATLNARAFYVSAGFREIARSTTRRNNVLIPTIIMEWEAGDPSAVLPNGSPG